MGKAIIIKGADFSQVAVASNTIPVTGLAITGASGSQTQRQMQLSVSYTPADTTQLGVVWSVISGNATITSDGLLTYNGSTASASVVVKATSSKNSSVYAQATVSFALPAIEAPTFSPAQGTYSQAQSVALSCGTAGATIYYTTNGSTPTTSSSVYSSPIAVATSKTIKAIAVKNGQSSNVATANYVIAIPHTVTVSVTDGNDPVTGATVSLGGNAPISSSGGTYVFSVPDGTYTLNVSASGFKPHTEQVVVNGSEVTTSVTMQGPTDLLAKAFFANANCMGSTHYPLYSTMITAASGQSPTAGAYISANNAARASIVIHREDATSPITFQSWKSGGTYDTQVNQDAAQWASLVEWPADIDEIELKVLNSDYYFDWGLCNAAQTSIYQKGYTGWLQGGSTQIITFKRTDYPNAEYVGLWFKYQANANWNNSATLDDAQVSLMEKL